MIKELLRFVVPIILMIASAIYMGSTNELDSPLTFFMALSVFKIGFAVVIYHVIRKLYVGTIVWGNGDKVAGAVGLMIMIGLILGS